MAQQGLRKINENPHARIVFPAGYICKRLRVAENSSQYRNLKRRIHKKNRFYYGVEVSRYGFENNRVDLETLSQVVGGVLNNEIIKKTVASGLGPGR